MMETKQTELRKTFGQFVSINLHSLEQNNHGLLRLQDLIEKSRQYHQVHTGLLVHTFPGNDLTCNQPPWLQQTQTGGGLAIPYQKEQAVWLERHIGQPNPIWVAPLPATFFITPLQNQQPLIRHYLCGLYAQVGLGNGICVPIRYVTKPFNSQIQTSQSTDQTFDHPMPSLPDISVLRAADNGETVEYAFGAGEDKAFCTNHGAFLEQELNLLEYFMHQLQSVTTEEQLRSILSGIDRLNAEAFWAGYQLNTHRAWYNLENKIITESNTVTEVTAISISESAEDKEDNPSISSIGDHSAMVEEIPNQFLPIQHQSVVSQIADLKNLVESSVLPQELLLSKLTELYQAAMMAAQQRDTAPITQLEYEKYGQTICDALIAARSSGYSAMVVIGPDGYIDTDKLSINVRHSGAQFRHVTPVCFVQNALLYAIVNEMTPKEAIIALLDKMDSLLPGRSIYIGQEIRQQDYVQAIFDHFGKLRQTATTSDVTNLFLLLSVLYNKLPWLALNDDYVKIVENTQERYFVPRPFFFSNTSSLVHKKEGSFISAHQKILIGYEFVCRLHNVRKTNIDVDLMQLNDAFSREHIDDPFDPSILSNSHGKDSSENKSVLAIRNKILSNQSAVLSEGELAQVIYSVYATFDYLPLPINAKFLDSKKIDSGKHRYPTESAERLYILSANHLQLIFEAHPALAERYHDKITLGFLHYVAHGVDKNGIEALVAEDVSWKTKKNNKIITLTRDYLFDHFIAEGFYSQSTNKVSEFNRLVQKVLEILHESNHGLRIWRNEDGSYYLQSYQEEKKQEKILLRRQSSLDNLAVFQQQPHGMKMRKRKINDTVLQSRSENSLVDGWFLTAHNKYKNGYTRDYDLFKQCIDSRPITEDAVSVMAAIIEANSSKMLFEFKDDNDNDFLHLAALNPCPAIVMKLISGLKNSETLMQKNKNNETFFDIIINKYNQEKNHYQELDEEVFYEDAFDSDNPLRLLISTAYVAFIAIQSNKRIQCALPKQFVNILLNSRFKDDLYGLLSAPTPVSGHKPDNSDACAPPPNKKQKLAEGPAKQTYAVLLSKSELWQRPSHDELCHVEEEDEHENKHDQSNASSNSLQ